MKYVKLIAKPDTWFKAGTEVYDYDSSFPSNLKRITLDVWEECSTFTGIKAILATGIRVADTDHEIELFGVGERWDGEHCSCDEFDVEIVDEAF